MSRVIEAVTVDNIMIETMSRMGHMALRIRWSSTTEVMDTARTAEVEAFTVMTLLTEEVDARITAVLDDDVTTEMEAGEAGEAGDVATDESCRYAKNF